MGFAPLNIGEAGELADSNVRTPGGTTYGAVYNYTFTEFGSYNIKPKIILFQANYFDVAYALGSTFDVDYTLGMNGNTPILQIFYRSDIGIWRLGFTGFLYTPYQDVCTKDKIPYIQAGEIFGDFTGLPIDKDISNTGTITINTAFDYFFPHKPAFIAVGFTGILMTRNIPKISVKIDSWTENSITTTVTRPPGYSMTKAKLQFVASDWGKSNFLNFNII